MTSIGVSSNFPVAITPALLIQKSILPLTSNAFSARCSTSLNSETLVGTAMADAPSASQIATVSSRASFPLAASTRLQPSFAKASAAANPTPLDAPVMTTVF